MKVTVFSVEKLIIHNLWHSWECVNLNFVLPYNCCMFSIVMYLKMYQLTNLAHLGRHHTNFCAVMQCFIGSVWNVAHTLLQSCGQTLNCAQTPMWFNSFSLVFQRGFKKNENKCCLFGLSFTRSNVLFSYINFTFPQTSKCFLSNGINNMYILASSPELQALRFG